MKKARLFFISSAVIMMMLTVCVFLFLWFSHTPLIPSDVPPHPTVQSTKQNINTATAEQLAQLPGIGSKLAQAIVAYRIEHGKFQSIGELTRVPGIGPGKLEAIADMITVGG